MRHSSGVTTRVVVAIAIVFVVAGAAAQRDEGQSGSDGGTFIVVSITAFNQFTFDVKLKNPRTGYVHSVTVTVDVARLLRIGDRVRKRTRGREVILVPVGAPSEEPEQPPRRPPPFHFPWEQPAGAAEKPPCSNLPCTAPPALDGPTSLRKAFTPQSVPSTRTVRVASMRFLYDRVNAANPSLGDCDVLTSGSFTSGGYDPAVPLMVAGQKIGNGYFDKNNLPFHETDAKGVTTRFRGAVILSGGVPAIVRQTGDLATDFAGRTNFMGGGALLLHRGYRISHEDLCCCQAFVNVVPKTRQLDPATCGFNAGQLVAGAQHIVVASRGDAVYVFAIQLSGREIQRVLFEAGFTDAVLFDGGAGAFMLARDAISKQNEKGFVFNGRRGNPAGINSTRLCIRTAK